MLSEAERQRARGFHFQHDRRDYVLAHALLRVTLARHVPGDPASLTFASSATGRPSLVGGPAALDFSLTHTAGLAAVAVTSAAVVGIDGEELKQVGDHLELAERYFADAEARALRALPAEQGRRRFLELWTLKEAYAKACGAGLSLPLNEVAFTVVPGGPPRATFASESVDQRESWQFAVVYPTPRHVLALARSGRSPLRPQLLTASFRELGAVARIEW